VVRAARQWLDANQGQPVFAFVHLFDLHTPYSAAAGGDLVPQTAGYDSELQHVDQLLGRFRQALVAGGWWDRALVLLSDHGESLGEHGESSHSYFIYQSTIWVPLMIHWPAQAMNAAPNFPARSERQGGLIDVAPTILDYLGIPKPSSFAGESLIKASGHAVFSETVYTRDAFHWAPLRSLLDGAFQYIDAPKPELYNWESDRREQTNLIGTHTADAQKLREQLANLLMHYAALFREVLNQDSHNTLARYDLGEAYLRAHQAESAIREWTAALRLDPEYVPADEALGQLWMGRQDYGRARGYYQQALAGAPGDFEALVGAAAEERRLRMMPEARQHLEKAGATEPDFAECRK
jgi:tetratricopeptide (TPR) repeat protein